MLAAAGILGGCGGCGGSSQAGQQRDGAVSRADYVAAVHAVRACMRQASLAVSELRLSIVDATILDYDVLIGARDPDEVSRVSTECEDRFGADVILRYTHQTADARAAVARQRFADCGIALDAQPSAEQIACLRTTTPRVDDAEHDE